MHYHIRTAAAEDLPKIEEIYAYARSFMAEHGNPTQWETSYPPNSLLTDDISKKYLYVIEDSDGIHGVFYFRIGPDPTYEYMEDGHWRSSDPYGTIHRIAGDGKGGILKNAVAFSLSQIAHLRIDTHHDNTIMQTALLKAGFHRCGIIYIEDGTPRIAYDLLK